MHYIDAFNPTISCFCMGINAEHNIKSSEQYFKDLRESFVCHIKWHKVNTFFFLIKDCADIDLVNTLQDIRMHIFCKSLIVGIFCDGFKDNLSAEYKEKYDEIAKSCDVKIDLRIPYTQECEQKIIKSLIDRCPYCILTNSDSKDPIIEKIIKYLETKEKNIFLL